MSCLLHCKFNIMTSKSPINNPVLCLLSYNTNNKY